MIQAVYSLEYFKFETFLCDFFKTIRRLFYGQTNAFCGMFFSQLKTAQERIPDYDVGLLGNPLSPGDHKEQGVQIITHLFMLWQKVLPRTKA